MQTKIETEASTLLAKGRTNTRHLAALGREHAVVGGVQGCPVWRAIVGTGGQRQFAGVARHPGQAVAIAICYDIISQQGWG